MTQLHSQPDRPTKPRTNLSRRYFTARVGIVLLSVILLVTSAVLAVTPPRGASARPGSITTSGAPGTTGSSVTPGTPGTSGSPGTITRTEAMRREPYTDARSVLSLRAGTRITVLERRGGWYRATSGRNSGWVRMLSVRLATVSTDNRATTTATGRSGSGGLVSTTGIRALDAGDLKAAVFSETEAARLATLAVTAEEARRHAFASGLSARTLPYLPAPRATPRSNR